MEADPSVNQAFFKTGEYLGPCTLISFVIGTNLLAQVGGSTSSLLTSSVRRASSPVPQVLHILIYHFHANAFSSILLPASSSAVIFSQARTGIVLLTVIFWPIKGSVCNKAQYSVRINSSN